jgi:cytochrome c-type biogenesis protein CcmH
MRIARHAGTALLVAALLGVACDRGVEPFDPNEKVAAPDLSKIFPPGAERAPQDGPMGAGGSGPPGMPAPPGVPAASAAPAAMGAAPEGAAGGAGAPIRGRIVVSDALAARVPRGGVLFLIARASDAGPPTAVKRVPGPAFPFEFEIGPGDRMMEGVPFTGPFTLTARIDADGNAATKNPGDLQGQSRERVAPGASGVEVVIDQVL